MRTAFFWQFLRDVLVTLALLGFAYFLVHLVYYFLTMYF
jgi:hypothetical protein